MLVEAPDKWAVEWTRPRDFPANTENPNKKLATLRKGGFLTAFGDGSAAVISEDIPPDALNGLIIRDDRAILDDVEKWIHRVPPTAKPR